MTMNPDQLLSKITVEANRIILSNLVLTATLDPSSDDFDKKLLTAQRNYDRATHLLNPAAGNKPRTPKGKTRPDL